MILKCIGDRARVYSLNCATAPSNPVHLNNLVTSPIAGGQPTYSGNVEAAVTAAAVKAERGADVAVR
jgi:hypothetical protein